MLLRLRRDARGVPGVAVAMPYQFDDGKLKAGKLSFDTTRG